MNHRKHPGKKNGNQVVVQPKLNNWAGVNISQKAVPFGYGIVLKFGKVLVMWKKNYTMEKFWNFKKTYRIVSEILRNIYPWQKRPKKL